MSGGKSPAGFRWSTYSSHTVDHRPHPNNVPPRFKERTNHLSLAPYKAKNDHIEKQTEKLNSFSGDSFWSDFKKHFTRAKSLTSSVL